MACETAVVASNVGGIPEVVTDGENGVLVDRTGVSDADFEIELARAVNALCADPDRARQLGVAGRQRAVRDFSWDAIARSTVALYQSLIISG